jgi:UDPglucose 6-dehydrogenase
MRIAMIGAGYVGLTTATCLAEMGHQVTCADIDAERIERLSRRELPIYEPGLEALLGHCMETGRLRFVTAVQGCVDGADAVFLAVGTPSRPDGEMDISQVETAARQIAPHLKTGAVVVIKSTVTAGTCRRIREVIADRRRSLDFSVASNPEFLREGSAIDDFMAPDRVVIGADDARSAAVLRGIYKPLEVDGVPILSTSTANAELIKQASNALLALKIGFINDVADLCEKINGDVMAVAEGIGLDRRIGRSFLTPGPGYGGSCFPKDTRAFAASGRRHGAPQILVEALVPHNERRKAALAQRVLSEARLKRGSRVAILGLAFKAETDDIRESAALAVIPPLLNAGVRVSAHDPQAMNNARQLLDNVAFFDTPYAAAANADAVVVLTEWKEYRNLDLARLASAMRGSFVFDFRNVLSPRAAAKSGLTYSGLGRRPLAPESKARRGVTPALAPLDQRVAAPRHL